MLWVGNLYILIGNMYMLYKQIVTSRSWINKVKSIKVMPLLLYTYVSIVYMPVVMHWIRCTATWSWIASPRKDKQILTYLLLFQNSHPPPHPPCPSMESYLDLHSAAAGFFYSDRCYRLPYPVSYNHQGRPIVSSARYPAAAKSHPYRIRHCVAGRRCRMPITHSDLGW